MNYRTKILIGALAIGLVGCGGDDDGSTPPPVMCADTGMTYSYLVNALVIDPTAGGQSAGFNLDGVTTTAGGGALDLGCGQTDYTGLDGVTGGIDNQVGPLLGAVGGLIPGLDVQDTIDSAINSGSALIVANVENVDSLTSDDCVGLSLVTGLPIEPALDPATMLDGSETINVDPTTLDGSGNPLITATGSIVGGLLSASDLTLEISIPFNYMGTDIPISLTVVGATLEADITATDLMNGNIGGAISEDDILALTGDLLSAISPGTDLSTIATVIAGFLDIHIAATPGSEACDGISAGIIFGAVEAQNVVYP